LGKIYNTTTAGRSGEKGKKSGKIYFNFIQKVVFASTPLHVSYQANNGKKNLEFIFVLGEVLNAGKQANTHPAAPGAFALNKFSSDFPSPLCMSLCEAIKRREKSS
jgi:hypothetical protein